MKVLLSDGQLAEQPQSQKMAFFRLAFRPLFLLGSLFSIVSVGLWGAYIGGYIAFEVYGGTLWWHIHEMLFGFVAAIMTGFLLTAVQTWTKVPSIKGIPLMLLVALWLLARLLFFLPEWVSEPDLVKPWIAWIDILFLPAAALCLAYPLVKVKQWRNMIFVPILLAMAIVNGAMHCAVAINDMSLLAPASQVMVMLVTLVMCILGGRVFPMFTANGTKTQRVVSLPWLEKLAIASVVAAVLVTLADAMHLFENVPESIKASVYFIAGISNFIRALRWRIWVTWSTPLVWPLHLSYWAIAIGLLLMGFSKITDWVSSSQAIHAITVGGMGVMILAMISRVSLGHTGRFLSVGKVMTIAFSAIAAAFIVRVFGSYFSDHYLYVVMSSALLWMFAYACFVVKYAPVLTQPRVDGAPG